MKINTHVVESSETRIKRNQLRQPLHKHSHSLFPPPRPARLKLNPFDGQCCLPPPPPLLLSRSKMLHVCFRIFKLLIVSISISKEETHKLIFCAHCQWKLKSKPNKTTKNQNKTKQNPKVPRTNVYKFSNRSWKTPIKFGFSSNVPSTPGSSPAPASF